VYRILYVSKFTMYSLKTHYD